MALHADEGFAFGDSACLGRGVDFRYFFDSSTLKVVAALRYSMKSVGGWSAQDDETSPAWGSTLVHGGMIETIMDEVPPGLLHTAAAAAHKRPLLRTHLLLTPPTAPPLIIRSSLRS